MAKYYPVERLPMRMQCIDDSTMEVIDETISTWLIFPQEIKHGLAAIIEPYVDSTDDMDMAVNTILDRIEMQIRMRSWPMPWAVVFFPEEYPLSGYLMSIRSSEDIRFSAYSVLYQGRYDPLVQGAPPLSVLLILNKKSLLETASKGSPLLADVYQTLCDADEDGCWAMFAEPLDPQWVESAAVSNSRQFFDAIGVRSH